MNNLTQIKEWDYLGQGVVQLMSNQQMQNLMLQLPDSPSACVFHCCAAKRLCAELESSVEHCADTLLAGLLSLSEKLHTAWMVCSLTQTCSWQICHRHIPQQIIPCDCTMLVQISNGVQVKMKRVSWWIKFSCTLLAAISCKSRLINEIMSLQEEVW